MSVLLSNGTTVRMLARTRSGRGYAVATTDDPAGMRHPGVYVCLAFEPATTTLRPVALDADKPPYVGGDVYIITTLVDEIKMLGVKSVPQSWVRLYRAVIDDEASGMDYDNYDIGGLEILSLASFDFQLDDAGNLLARSRR